MYVVDSGVRTSHREFHNEMSSSSKVPIKDGSEAVSSTSGKIGVGINFVDDGDGGSSGGGRRGEVNGRAWDRYGAFADCDGHGTHIAATVAGNDVGVAPSVVVHPVRVLGCDGAGRASDVVSGLEWVAAHVMSERRKIPRTSTSTAGAGSVWPSVVTLALGVPAGEWSRALERAAAALTTRLGILVVVASGNFRSDACTVSPGRITETLTVAASVGPGTAKTQRVKAGADEPA